MTADDDLRAIALNGIELCRRDRWAEGLEQLARVTRSQASAADLPSQFYAYLGFGIAHRQRRVREGLQLCEHAVRLEFYEPENYVQLARTAMLAGRRRRAVTALRQGLAIDPSHRELREVLIEIGRRRRPVLPFLSRSNPVNRLLGRIRHGLFGPLG